VVPPTTSSGLFIHWGLYAIPAGYWKGQRSPGIGEWIMNRMKNSGHRIRAARNAVQPREVRRRCVGPQFAVDAGMKYVVITSKQPRRLRALQVCRQQIQRPSTPRPSSATIIKELAAACARHGLRFGVYYSQSQDWHEPGGHGQQLGFSGERGEGQERRLRRPTSTTKVEPQLKELLTPLRSAVSHLVRHAADDDRRPAQGGLTDVVRHACNPPR